MMTTNDFLNADETIIIPVVPTMIPAVLMTMTNETMIPAATMMMTNIDSTMMIKISAVLCSTINVIKEVFF